MNKQTHLKCISNGRVFLFSEQLKTRNDMVPCNAEGQIAEGHIGNAESVEAGHTRRVTKYLGNVKNGVLYKYTEFLAERDDMVSIDTEEQWASMRETGEAPEVAASTVVPTLQRAVNAPPIDKAPEEALIPAQAQGPGTVVLPVIEGMGAREAKTLLSEWAEKEFKVKLDRRLALDEFVKECESLAIANLDKVAG